MSRPRSIVLIGLSGAGKTTVARHAAEQLGAGWTDLDALIAALAGKSVARIFADDGEAAFRVLEQQAMAGLLDGEPQVIATGAGWAVQPGALPSLAGRALSIYLEVDPAVAARRLQGATDRPLLNASADNMEATLRRQAADRIPWYQRADLEIAASSGSSEVVAAGVAAAARSYGGWASR